MQIWYANVGVYFELNVKIYLNNSAILMSEIGEGDKALGQTRRSVVGRYQTGLASSTTSMESKFPLLGNSTASIVTGPG